MAVDDPLAESESDPAAVVVLGLQNVLKHPDDAFLVVLVDLDSLVADGDVPLLAGARGRDVDLLGGRRRCS